MWQTDRVEPVALVGVESGNTGMCYFCLKPAENPIACARPGNRGQPDAGLGAHIGPHHDCCFTCVKAAMMVNNVQVVNCPNGCRNVFANINIMETYAEMTARVAAAESAQSMSARECRKLKDENLWILKGIASYATQGMNHKTEKERLNGVIAEKNRIIKLMGRAVNWVFGKKGRVSNNTIQLLTSCEGTGGQAVESLAAEIGGVSAPGSGSTAASVQTAVRALAVKLQLKSMPTAHNTNE